MQRTPLTLAVLFAIAAGLASCSKPTDPGHSDLKAGLAAHWSANSNVSTSTATLTGAVAVVTTDAGKIYSFDRAGGKVLVADSPKLNFGANQNFSITARIQPQPANTSFGVMSIVDKRNVAGISGAVGYSVHLEEGHLACQLAPAVRWPWNFSDFTSPGRIKAWWARRKQIVPKKFARFISTGPDLRDGKFHDVALTVERKSKTGGKLFVDGELVLTFDPTQQSQSFANTAPLLIGGHPDPALNCGFRGKIGDVRLYARALTTNEVETLNREMTTAASSH